MEYASIRLSSTLGPVEEWQTLEQLNAKYVFVYFSDCIQWIDYGQKRMVQVMEMTGASIVFSNRFQEKNGELTEAPLIDYQLGSVRDDFEFGKVILLDREKTIQALHHLPFGCLYATWYALRLNLSSYPIVRIPEFLYYEIEEDLRTSGEKIFDYVNPKNIAVQQEMEKVFEDYLMRNHYYIPMSNLKTTEHLQKGSFPVTLSIVIPCRNRVQTIRDAIESALGQQIKPQYTFNVIVVDDNSTDGTVDIIKELVAENCKRRHEDKSMPELIYLAQDETYHAIGGNWNRAIYSDFCGKYSLQLDSDDTYARPDVLNLVIDMFERYHYGLIIGSYQLTDFAGVPIPPGVIDHREWTDRNGHNNALRINGLGAPRAFDTTLLREIGFPTVKYGEDYAVVLRISREYKIGRIWEVLYNCRRWNNNSDANCDTIAMNNNNLYKDRLRTFEMMARHTLVCNQ